MEKFMKRAAKTLLALLMCFGVLQLNGFAISKVHAEGEEGPAHSKTLTLNDDGTYTIALNVTGDSEKKIQKVNVIVIVDRSGSMDDPSGTGAYVPSNRNWEDMYGFIDGNYVPLERRGYYPSYTYYYNGEQYTGQRYLYDNTATRMEATQSAVNVLANTLLSYNGKDGNPDNTVQMALVSFADNATIDVSSTTSYTTFSNAVNRLNANEGTNWEAGLRRAGTVSFGDDDPTFVIFFSDGAPTYYLNEAGNRVLGTGYEEQPNMQTCYDAATDDAATLASSVGTDRFYTIFAYGTNTGKNYMSSLTTAAGAPAENNYAASSTAELNDAFAAILESIEMSGIGAVSIEDGTTASVKTTSGEISSLLTVDEGSFKYYRAGGMNDNETEKYDHTANGGLGEEWEDAPAASFDNGAVTWDLEDEGVLENGVTYTVTFNCWPSQTTLDIVADIKNDPSSYNSLDENIKKYIDETGKLKTNTTATLSYDDTRTSEKEESITYDNPSPVATQAVEQFAITKEWEDTFEDGHKPQAVNLTVTCDGKDKYTVELSDSNNWTASKFISIGIIRGTGENVEVLEKGHDFTFTEPSELGYYWELEVPTVRPMLINNVLTMLILKEAEAPFNNPNGTTEYTIDGKTYYVGTTGEAELTATNHRRARLNLTKVVDGEDADPEQTFPFTLNVVDSMADKGSADNLNSDYYVWFSVYNGGYVDAVVSGATKEMKDGAWTGYYYAPSGTYIDVNLKAGDGLRFLNLPSGSTYTFTEGTLPANYAFKSSELTAGTDSTFSGKQTTKGTIEDANTDYAVKYTNQYDLSDVEITKVWEDGNDQDGIRPTAEEFKSYLVLNADGTDVTSANASKLTVTENEDGTYTAKWTGLNRFAEGKEITYTVEETEITGYTTSGSPAQDKGTITNTHTTEVADVTVTKEWADNSDQDGKRPNSVKFQLYADGELVNGKTVIIQAPEAGGNTWTAKFNNLPVNAGGKPIKYSVKELDGETEIANGGTLPGKDNASYTVTYTEEEPLTVTNTYTPEKTSLNVKKVWSDNNDQDGNRPTSVTFQLYKTVGETTSAVADKTIELSSANADSADTTGNTWIGTFTDLPKYEAGTVIVYSIKEMNGTTAIEDNGKLPGKKTDLEEYTVTYSDNNTTVKNTYTPETTEKKVKKVWDDNNNQDGIRPTELTVKLMNGTTEAGSVILSESNSWTDTISNLPKYANGTEIQYEWVETLPEDSGYTKKSQVIDETDAALTVITNTHTPATTTVTVTKVWEDADNQDGIRPETVQIKLLAGGKEYTGDNATITLPIDGKLTYTWEGLPKYAGTTTPVVYTVEEVKTDVITGVDGVGTYKFEVTGTQADGYEVKNIHTPETTSITVTKNWDDNSDQDGKRPTSVTYQVYAGGTAVTGELATITIGKPDGAAVDTWTKTVEGYPKYAGTTTPIVYTIKEVDASGNELAAGDELDDYYTLKEYGTDGLSATNTHTPETTGKTVVKVWDDNQNAEGFRPTTLTVNLLADGDVYDSVTLSEENSWTDTIDGLDVYKNGQPIEYTWSEVLPEPSNPEGSYSQISSVESTDATTGYVVTTITNKHTPNQTSVPVTKVWEDSEDQDGIRPDSVQVQLMVGEEAIGDPVTLPIDGKWSYTWTGLDKYVDGQAIQYTVMEIETTVITGTDGPGTYAYAITGTQTGGYTVTNKHTPEKTTFTATKVWEDDGDRDGLRTTSVTAVLKADGTAKDEQTLSADNEWTFTWTGLDKYRDKGTEIKYTVEEKAVPDKYTASVEGGTITNTHVPEKVTVPVEKKWDDADNQDGIRPESITVSLKADGTEVQTATLNEANGWKYTFESTETAPLYKYKAVKQPITYTVEETKVPEGYEMSQEGNVITNKHVPAVIDLTVKKEWKDNDNNDGKRPASVTVILKADGEGIRQLTLNEDNKWTEKVTGLPKNKAGKEIKYTFEEMTVTDYTVEYSEIVDGVVTITNTHEDELINITVIKEWKFDEGYDVRPEEVNVVLSDKKGYIANLSQPVTEETEWKTEFKNLNKYYKGEEIEYAADEEEIPVGYKKTLTTVEKNKEYKITNEFKPIKYDPPVKKEVTGDTSKADKNDKFTFKFEAVTEGAPLPESTEVTIKAGEEHEFGWMYLTEPGTYKYKITEVDEKKPGYKYSDKEYELVFTIGTEGTEDSEQLTCKLTVNGEEVDHEAQDAYKFEFVNEYREYVDVEVEKVWVDGNNADGKRPEEIEVTLYANNKAVETVKLNEGNKWKYTWADQPYSDDSFKEIKYTVKEDKVPEGYTMTSAQSNNKVTITNTVKTPETGDMSNVGLWMSLFGASMAGTLGAAYVSLKKKKEEE